MIWSTLAPDQASDIDLHVIFHQFQYTPHAEVMSHGQQHICVGMVAAGHAGKEPWGEE